MAGPASAVEETPAAKGQARIVCDGPTHDFGVAWEGSILVHEFRFEAAGDEDLTIINVKPDCGCTAADLELVRDDGTREKYEFRTPVPPGTKFAMAVTFNTRGREGQQPKNIHLYANVPGGAATMTLEARVKPFLAIQPKIQALGKISVLDTATAEFTVSSVGGERYKLEPTRRALPPEVSIETEPMDPDDDGRATSWKVKATLGPGMPKGTRTYPLDLQTDLENPHGPVQSDGSRARFVVSPSVNAMVVGPVSALPQNVNFGIMRSDQTVAKSFRVECHDPDFVLPEPKAEVKPIRDGASVAFAETLRLTTRRDEEANAWEVEVLLEGLGEEVARSFLGRLVVETGHPQEPTLEITLSGLKQGG